MMGSRSRAQVFITFPILGCLLAHLIPLLLLQEPVLPVRSGWSWDSPAPAPKAPSPPPAGSADAAMNETATKTDAAKEDDKDTDKDTASDAAGAAAGLQGHMKEGSVALLFPALGFLLANLVPRRFF